MLILLKQVIRGISSLKIQGARNVAVASVTAVAELSQSIKSSDLSQFADKMSKAKSSLESARPTEPMVRNALSFVLNDLGACASVEEAKLKLKNNAEIILNYFEESKKKIVLYGASLIRNNARVFTHCHSSTVVAVLLEAKKQGKTFSVNNTETRPLFQGRTTAVELSNAGIVVNHYSDSAAGDAIDNSDIVLLGCDAITPYGIYNKIGTRLFCEHASRRRIPVYVCTNSLKFENAREEKIEQRNPKEIWPNAPKNVAVHNPAFSKVPPELAKRIVCEFGILRFKRFVKLARN